MERLWVAQSTCRGDALHAVLCFAVLCMHPLQGHRIAHELWGRGRKVMACALQSRMSEVFAVDIHPAARFGKGILLDHGTGVVIGETAELGNNVSILQNVTLGGACVHACMQQGGGGGHVHVMWMGAMRVAACDAWVHATLHLVWCGWRRCAVVWVGAC